MIGVAIRSQSVEGSVMSIVFIVTGIWFVLYWFWIEDKRNH